MTKIINTLFTVVIFVTSLMMSYANAGNWQQNVSIGGFNNVHIYTPDSTSSIGNGKALLIVLHGCVQPINNYLNANLEDAAEQYGMVIAVPDAMNKAGYNCWSYWQGAKNRSSGDYKNLINLANTMSSDASRGIDPDQVYLTGLSSGGAFTQQAACVAPDVFAGVASSAGPTLGTSSNGALNNCEVVSPATFKSRCESYAGSYVSHLSDQIAVVGHGTADTTVDTCYNQQNANGYANVYGVNQLAGTRTVSDDATRTASVTDWQDGRVAMVWFNGLDHSWSGGQGASGDYIASNSINFATFLGQHFLDNNKRVNRNQGPVVDPISVADNGGYFTISGNAIDPDGSVQHVDIDIFSLDTNPKSLVDSIQTTVAASDGYFSVLSGSLSNGLYQLEVVATDDLDEPGEKALITSRIGPPPPPTAPELSNVVVSVAAQCATVSGNVVDQNQDNVTISVNFSNGNVNALVNDNSFSAEQCGLAGGNQSATITATDPGGLSDSVSVSFTIDAGKTGNYNYHINEGHITWGYGYSECYIEFGTSEFTMREFPTGSNQCYWMADGAPSCKGPNQACQTSSQPSDSDGDGVDDSIDNCPSDPNADQSDNDSDGIGNVCDPTPNGDSSCTEFTSSNYQHVVAGRAVNNYGYAIAVGSGDNLGYYNTYITTTVAEVQSGFYEKGTCSNY